MNERNLRKVLLILCFLVVSLLAIMSTRYIVSGYEVSMYDVYPNFFWVLFVVGMSVPSALILTKTDSRKVSDYLPVLSLILSVFLLISLPVVRNYFLLGRGDVVSHLGNIQHIVKLGAVGDGNIYPIIHIYVSAFSFVSGFQPHVATVAVATLVYVCYCLSVIPLSKNISTNPTQAALIMTLLIIPVLGTDVNRISPWSSTFLLIPTLLLSYFILVRNSTDITQYILLGIPLLAAAISHPVNGLVSMFILLTLILFADRDVRVISVSSVKYVFLPVIGVVIYIQWFFSTPEVLGLVSREIMFFLQGTGTSDASTATGFFGIFSIYYLLEVILWRHGIMLLLSGLSFFAFLWYLWNYQSTGYNRYILIFGILSIVFTILSPMSDFLILSSFERLDRYSIFMSVIGFGLIAGKAIWASKRKSVLVSSILIVIVLVSAFSVISVYSSDRTKEPGRHVTENEIKMVNWTFEHGDTDTQIDVYGIFLDRYYFALTGDSNAPYPSNYTKSTPPPHFGYDKGRSPSELYEDSHYLLTSGITETYYEATFPDRQEYWRYTSEDITNLNTDTKVNKIYHNGDASIHKV